MSMSELGDTIRARREELGWTVEELASQTRDIVGFIQWLERGDATGKRTPLISEIDRIANALDLDPVLLNAMVGRLSYRMTDAVCHWLKEGYSEDTLISLIHTETGTPNSLLAPPPQPAS